MPITPLATEVADRLTRAELTYGEVGQTAGRLPPGYHHLHRSGVIGAGEDFFAEAARTLLGWRVYLRAGLRVSPSTTTVQPGSVVVLGVGAGPVRVSAPCRVVYLVHEPHRQGFAHGTLPGHPESGEEAFMIEQREDGTVTFTITAFSRAATVLAKAAGPVGRAIQRHMSARYLGALTD